METNKLVKIVRQYLCDTDNKQWSDNEIISFLNSAAEKYSTDSELFRNTVSIYPGLDGTYNKPEDFVRFMCGWNERGNQIELTTSSELNKRFGEYYPREGTVEAIYDDLSAIDGYRPFPLPPDNQNLHIIHVTGYGELNLSGYGVVKNGYGVVLKLEEYDEAGEMQYIRAAQMEEITDYMALVYYACSLACNVDTDFADPQKGKFFITLYHQRIGNIQQLKRRFAGAGKNACYY